MMNFSLFLSTILTPHFFTKYSVIYFRSNNAYPLLFFSLLFKKIRQTHKNTITLLDVTDMPWNTIQNLLETSFLGMQNFYWLKNVENADERTKKYIMHYLTMYEGPHLIGAYGSIPINIEKSNLLEVVLESTIDQHKCIELLHFFNIGVSNSVKDCIARIFNQTKTIPLDCACLLMYYMQLVGSSTHQFLNEYIPKIVIPEKSLFTLSTYFFAKKVKPFLTLLSTLSVDYAEQFWIVYWSEQLWRAAHFVELSQAQQVYVAKKMAVRLPFTFIQKDWKQFSVAELRAAHHALYTIDYSLKNGGNAIGLDLFYSNFFLGKFKNI